MQIYARQTEPFQYNIRYEFRYSDYDVIVVGGGRRHQASLAAARIGLQTLLITQTVDTISRMSVQPLDWGRFPKAISCGDRRPRRQGPGKTRRCVIQRLLNKAAGRQCNRPAFRRTNSYMRRLRNTPSKKKKSPYLSRYGCRCYLLADCGKRTCGRGIGGVQAVRRRQDSFHTGGELLTTGTFMEGKIYVGEFEAEEAASAKKQQSDSVQPCARASR